MSTIRDVAKRAGVSISTASRILSNSTKETYPKVTQDKVWKASEELGYRPNLAARALVSGETRIVAAVFPRIYDTPFTALASLQILSSIEAFCSENGYHLLLSSPYIREGKVDPNFINLLSSGYLDGIIVDGHFHVEPIMEVVEKFKLPTIMLGYHAHPYYLRSDNRLGGKLLMDYILQIGHRNIGVIELPEGVSVAASERLYGVKMAYEACGLDYQMLPRVHGKYSSESGAAAAAALIEAHPYLTAIIALNDRMAMGAVRQLQEMGYLVPDQISVVGYDDLPQTREFNPPLTTINQQLNEWGALTMNMLLTLLEGREPESIILPPQLLVRKSAAPLEMV